MVMLSDFNNKNSSNTSYDKEVNEAIVAGKRALESLNAALESISSASSWGMFDMLGGGMLTSIVKRSKMKDGKYYMEKAKRDLKDFSKELGDINIADDLDIEVDGFLDFADTFFDSFVVDFLVQNKISDAKYKLQDAIEKVEDILDKIS